MDIATNLSKEIKARRTAKGLTQEALATKVDVVRATIVRWEKRPAESAKVKDIKNIAAVLECSIDDLLGIHLQRENATEEELWKMVRDRDAQIRTMKLSTPKEDADLFVRLVRTWPLLNNSQRDHIVRNAEKRVAGTAAEESVPNPSKPIEKKRKA